MVWDLRCRLRPDRAKLAASQSATRGHDSIFQMMMFQIPVCGHRSIVLRNRPLAPAFFLLVLQLVWQLPLNAQLETLQVSTNNGVLQGALSADGKVKSFKDVPYAAPPIGPLRWKPPQPPASWTGVRQATDFGPRCMQGPIFPDMVFRDSGPSEDCLSLNIWTPAARSAPLPVMVWIFGGGFAAGAASEPRQDGANLTKQGVVVVNLNYRLGIFGFFAHPDLAKESAHHSAGNYGLLDQLAAIEWVKHNIALFGGDPSNITIFGESAGSFSVSALMASPLAQGLFNHAIGESGAFFSLTLPLKPLAEAENADVKFAQSALGTSSLESLRDKSSGELLAAALKQNIVRFSPDIDGYFLPEDVSSIYSSGHQCHIPLLAGWNADEGSYKAIFHDEAPTAKNYVTSVRALFGPDADKVLRLYPGKTDAQAKRSAQDLAGDQFIGYSTWKWLEMQSQTGGSPVFRYEFDQATPLSVADKAKDPARTPTAYHSSEIEFVFGVLASKKLPWHPADYMLSNAMSEYWANFAKTGNPNGEHLPSWPAYNKQDGYPVMHLNASPHVAPDSHHQRYEFLESRGTDNK